MGKNYSPDLVKKYIGVAKKYADEFSKDPSSKVGAIIIDECGATISTGYNGFARKINEDYMSFWRDMKYLVTIHAEINALHFADRRWLEGCTMFVTHGPCHNCLLNIIHRGIRTVFYSDPSIVRDRALPIEKEAIRRLILGSGIQVISDEGKEYLSEIKLPLKPMVCPDDEILIS